VILVVVGVALVAFGFTARVERAHRGVNA
jgi:hypothetical protein